MHRSPALLLAALSTVCGVSALAHGQCDVYRTDIPDFDQRREVASGILGLPNNGSMHCAPTSAMNWLAYITSHGYPEVLGGPRDWQSNTHYNTMTSLINWLGNMMNTGSGTYNSDHVDGLTEWLEMTSPDNFTVALHSSSGSSAPSPEDLYDIMTAGGLATLCTSHWNYRPSEVHFEGLQMIVLPARFVRKSGGHCVSVARITDGCSDLPRVHFRDPAGFDGPKTSQASFVTQYLDTEPVPAYYAATETSSPVFRTQYRFVDNDPNRNSMINALVVITPLGGLSADAQQGTLSVFNQHRADTFLPLPTQSHSTPGNAPIISVRYLPHLGAAAVLTKSGPDRAQLYRFRIGTGEFTPIASIDRPGDMAVGLAGEVYIASRAASGHSAGVNVCMADGSVRFIGTTFNPSALAFDDATGRLGVVSAERHAIYSMVIDPRTGVASGLLEQPLPPNLALAGEISFAYGGFSGGVFVAAGDVTGDGIVELLPTPSGLAINPTSKINIPSPRNLQVDPRGRILCTSNGVSHEFVRDGDNGWRPNPAAKFAGRAVGDSFQVSIGRRGVDDLLPPNQRLINDPNDFPTGRPECPADFNLSGEVGVQDLFDFLAQFFAGSPEADFNASGGVSVQDLFDFLSAYFQGC